MRWLYYYINPVFDYFVLCDQALQAPAYHVNMIKVGGYVDLRGVWEPHSRRSKVKVRHYFQE